MTLISRTYGRDRVRVMRGHREGKYNEVRELTVQARLEGGFGAASTAGDNRTVVATDTIKNIADIAARADRMYGGPEPKPFKQLERSALVVSERPALALAAAARRFHPPLNK